jgi:hypothetical protein
MDVAGVCTQTPEPARIDVSCEGKDVAGVCTQTPATSCHRRHRENALCIFSVSSVTLW